ncbi:MAG: hypothetical protein Q7T26_07850 [Dehalococcoidia bacterium]|nr:hypothetical protein [Dehalococcoidia bacterium]
MTSRRTGGPDGPTFATQVLKVMDEWLSGKLSNAQAAEWAFQNTDVMEKHGQAWREAEALWQALAALAMLSSCQPEDARSTRREMEQARQALRAALASR